LFEIALKNSLRVILIPSPHLRLAQTKYIKYGIRMQKKRALQGFNLQFPLPEQS